MSKSGLTFVEIGDESRKTEDLPNTKDLPEVELGVTAVAGEE